MGTYQCAHCGEFFLEDLAECPSCKEPVRHVPLVRRRRRASTGKETRQGLLVIALAAAIYLFVDRASQITFTPALTQYWLPLLFLGGLGLILHGLLMRLRR